MMYLDLKALYQHEIEADQLVFENNPDYVRYMQETLNLCNCKDLPRSVFLLLDAANCISFVHGFRLGLKLRQWAEN